ncbi:FAD-binding dehydrogenase [Micrococcus sp. NPDC078436]|uniref:FAD-binding dehydrogenase n=1 Tax=Micrococcus sp. NPDC078436 TaxID=3154960 RepID=UPI0034508EA6
MTTVSPVTARSEHRADVVVLGHGLAGLVAAAELLGAGRRVVLVDQERAADLGGQAWWSFGGLFLVDSPEQRRLRVKDSVDLAWSDWQATAGFTDHPDDAMPRAWAEAYVHFAHGEKRAWLRERGHRLFPVVGWAERKVPAPGVGGNSVPRFHITWGTGPGIVEPFSRIVERAAFDGRLTYLPRHRVTRLITESGAVTGVEGHVLADDDGARGTASSRTVAGEFRVGGAAVVVASGGVGADHDAVRAAWPDRLGTPPAEMLCGVPASVDGSGMRAAREAGAALVHPDRMWHYTEGVANHDPIWPGHGIRILPGPSSLWLDATGRRLPHPRWPGFDTLGTLQDIRSPGSTAAGGRATEQRPPADHTWFVLNRRIIGKEFALSGSEQNPDLTGRSIRQVLGRVTQDVPGPVQAFLDRGEDFVQADSVGELVARMNALVPDGPAVDEAAVRAAVAEHEAGAERPGADRQVDAVRDARRYLGDRLIRTAAPHRLTDPKAGPLIAVRLRTLTRKTLGGLHTDLQGRVLDAGAAVIPGLYAAGEAAGFGGGGMHGHRALEGTFLGGCLFSGRTAGRAAAAETA